MRDWRPLLINVGYQFAMRWVNGHVRGYMHTINCGHRFAQVFYVRKGSLLADRLLEFSASIPYNKTDIERVVKTVCEPLGYFPASPTEYGCGSSVTTSCASTVCYPQQRRHLQWLHDSLWAGGQQHGTPVQCDG